MYNSDKKWLLQELLIFTYFTGNIRIFRVLLIIAGTLDENKYKFVVGTILFVLAAVLPYIILRFLYYKITLYYFYNF